MQTPEEARAEARRNYIDQYRFLMLGLMTYARTQGDYEVFWRTALEKCDAVLGRAFDAASPQKVKEPPQPQRKDGVK